jgi:hypothetical protein
VAGRSCHEQPDSYWTGIKKVGLQRIEVITIWGVMPMNSQLEEKMVKRLAGLEINALVKAKVLPIEKLKNAKVETGIPILDVEGSVLFYRVPITKGRATTAYADVAAVPLFGAPLLAFHMNMVWDSKELIKQAEAAAKKIMGKGRDLKYDRTEFVAYSYPKIAIRFLKAEKEIAMISLYTWELVPLAETGTMEPYHRRQSINQLIPAAVAKKRTKIFEERVTNWNQMVKPDVDVLTIDPDIIKIPWPPKIIHEERVIHYSPDLNTHSPCYELVAQDTDVWCVAASTKMILDFYRFVYTQDRIAAEEGLGTHSSPHGLPYGDEHKVVDTIEKLSSNGLDATLNMSPVWNEFQDEVNANRPLISFIPGHSRTVAGYSDTRLFTWYFSRFLRVYDPWSPHVGVITWENFDAQTYRATFTIKPKTV